MKERAACLWVRHQHRRAGPRTLRSATTAAQSKQGMPTGDAPTASGGPPHSRHRSVVSTCIRWGRYDRVSGEKPARAKLCGRGAGMMWPRSRNPWRTQLCTRCRPPPRAGTPKSGGTECAGLPQQPRTVGSLQLAQRECGRSLPVRASARSFPGSPQCPGSQSR